MDPILTRKLEKDDEFQKKLTKIVKDYVTQARNARDYWIGEFDIAHDILMCYAALSKEDFEKLEKGHPRRFILPTTATQITTMTTFIAQMLFGQDTPNKVEPRGAKDELPAEFMNQLLTWNSEQQPTYLQGYLWIQDALVYNRGIFYNSWAPIFKSSLEMVEFQDSENPNPETGEPTSFHRPVRKQTQVAGFCKRHLVSAYDFLCDPSLPIHRLQEMRFCGHKTLIPWTELKRRASLSPDQPAFVLDAKVTELKERNSGNLPSGLNVGAPVGDNSQLVSRTQYERQKAASPAGSFKADKEDAGIIECYELWVRLCPNDYKFYGEEKVEGGDEPVIFQILMANELILSINESTYMHGMFPYSVAEGRPNGIYQYSPSWVMHLKGIQDYIDWLKDRHQDALSRTVGNVFIINPEAVDVNDFLNPLKEGKIITLKPEAGTRPISEVIQQVPIKDLTENFQEEVAEFIKLSESVSGANSNMQGQMSGDGSATEYAGTQQMSAGRLASLARLLSVQGLVPQTRQFVENFQQFMSGEQELRFKGGRIDLPPELMGVETVKIDRNTIQGEFNFIAHDGTMPGTDAKKVAAITKVIEAASAFPDLFRPLPGNLDIRKLIFAGAKASGLNVENFVYTQDQLATLAGQSAPVPPSGNSSQGASPMPQPPGPSPEVPTLPDIGSVGLPKLGPIQPRPQTV